MQNSDKSVAEMTLQERAKLARELRIYYPRFNELLEAIENCHFQCNGNSEPECLFIKGETGAGKTTLYETYAARYPRQINDDGTTVPVLYSVVPAGATVRGVASKLLWHLGDPAYNKGSRDTMTTRLIGLTQDCGVGLIFLDELNHFYNRDSEILLKTVSDWLKELIIESKIPIVSFGLPKAEEVLSPETNPQLSRRFAHRLTLEPFQWNNNGREFRTFLHLVEDKLPLLGKSHLADEDLALRLYYASDGIVAYVMTLIRNGTSLALKQGQESLSLDILAVAFEKYVKRDKPKKKYNPFLENAYVEDLAKLDSASEANSVGDSTSSSQEKATNNRTRRGKENKTASDVLHK